MHYLRWYRTGQLGPADHVGLDRRGQTFRQPGPFAQRFWAKVNKTGTCWFWTSNTNQEGYGTFYTAGAMRKAHRLAYELTIGPIPKGLVLDHLCRVRNCVNPAHLEPVTSDENVRRGAAFRRGA